MARGAIMKDNDGLAMLVGITIIAIVVFIIALVYIIEVIT